MICYVTLEYFNYAKFLKDLLATFILLVWFFMQSCKEAWMSYNYSSKILHPVFIWTTSSVFQVTSSWEVPEKFCTHFLLMCTTQCHYPNNILWNTYYITDRHAHVHLWKMSSYMYCSWVSTKHNIWQLYMHFHGPCLQTYTNKE